MEIQVRTDNNVKGADDLIQKVEDEVIAGLGPFVDRITRVNVHLGDESASRRGQTDIRCMIEVRPAGHEPVAITHHAATADQATTGASRQMHELLTRMFGRLDERHPGAETIRGHQG